MDDRNKPTVGKPNSSEPVSDAPNPIGGSDESDSTNTLGEASDADTPRDLDVSNPPLDDLRPEDMADIDVRVGED